MSWARLAQRLAHRRAYYGDTIVEYEPLIGMSEYVSVEMLERGDGPAIEEYLKKRMSSEVGKKLIYLLLERGEENPTTLIADMVKIPEKGYLSNPPYQVGFYLQVYEVKPSLKEACEKHRWEK